jgi:hypothetical protein
MLTQLNDGLVKQTRDNIGHVLLISPRTFSYHIFISETLLSMGYAVTWWDERASSATWYKLALRLFPSMAVRWSEHFFRKQLYKLDPNSISHVLVIKGEGLSAKIAFDIRKTLISASMGIYLWDGIGNIKGVSNIIPAFDSVATFDPLDAKTFGWTYRPLFGRNISSNKDVSLPEKYDWCFIGTIHSDRHRVIHRLRQRYGKQTKSFVFCYFQTPFMLFMRHLFDWTLWFAPKGTLSTEPMLASDVVRMVQRSKAVLDIEHPRQHGFTMRMIETFLMEKKIITTNKGIFHSSLYHPSRVCVINRNAPEIPSEFLDQPYLTIPQNLKDYYSCEGWVSELLKIQDEARLCH